MIAVDRREAVAGHFSPRALLAVFDDAEANLRAKIVAIFVLLIAATVVVWALALLAFASRPLLLGAALLAYTFGLRHAVDADHISSIDNVTRKLMQEGKRPVSVGFFFSLGHSTIVVVASMIVYTTASAAERQMGVIREFSGLFGTSISAFFLIAIAIINMV